MSAQYLPRRGEDDVRGLIRRAGQRPLLTGQEEVRLAKLIERGDRQAKQLMVECNLRLVFAVAKPYRGRGVSIADLIQEGTIGLMQAVEGFDHRRGLKFSTYAVWWIRRSLLDAIGASRTIRVPVKAAQQLAAIHEVEAELERSGVHSVSVEAIAQRTGLTTMSVRTLRNAARVTRSLDEAVGEDATPLVDLIEDPDGVDPGDRAAEHEARCEAWAMLSMLPERHRQVLVRRYGLSDDRPQTHEEIGHWLGVGEERSRQLEREALHRLREVAASPRPEVARPSLRAAQRAHPQGAGRTRAW